LPEVASGAPEFDNLCGAEQSAGKWLNRHVSCGEAFIACSIRVARARLAQVCHSWFIEPWDRTLRGHARKRKQWRLEIKADGYR
jgi:hypothetical protein